MPKKRKPETEEEQSKRLEKEAQRRASDAAAEDNAIDAMVKRSIQRHGP